MERKVGRVFINYIEGINPILLEMVPSISRYVRCFGCYFFLNFITYQGIVKVIMKYYRTVLKMEKELHIEK